MSTADPQSSMPSASGEKPDDYKPWRTEGIGKDNGPAPAGSKKPTWWKWLIWAAVIYGGVYLLLSFQEQAFAPPTVAYSEFKDQLAADNVEQVFSTGSTIQGTLRNAAQLPDATDAEYETFSTERPTFAEDDLLAQFEANDVEVLAQPVVAERGTFGNLLISLLPIALLVGFYVWLFRRQSKLAGGLAGGLTGTKREPVNPEKVRATFDDVAGIDEVKAELEDVVDFLQNPDKYRAIGARPPKGVLLEGIPGTGKTLLARATAGEAGVPFFQASASEFIEMVVGVGARRVRELFEEARKVAPAIVFIDEIDTIGRKRGGAQALGGNDEREQTLNQILTEMDGFSAAEGVVVLAATNRAEVLDPALLRAGRFDRTITVLAPDVAGREQILAVHSRRVKLADDVDLGRVARSTPGMTGADLANLVNEAALLAVKREHAAVTMSDFTDAIEKVHLGVQRSIVMPEDERRRTAYHEAGHALLGMLQPGADPVRKVSISPRGRALGVTLSTPDTDRYGYDEVYLRGRIVGALGGMAAEEVVLGVVTTGAESDLQTSTGIARMMVGRWGMSEKIGPVQVFPEEGDPRSYGVSEGMLDAVSTEVRSIVEECFEQAKSLLIENRWRLDAIVEQLLEHETLDEPEIYAAAQLDRVPR